MNDLQPGAGRPAPEEPRAHELKTWPDFFRRILSGEKTFEIRRDDRGFRAGDTLWLREYVKRSDSYTGRELRVTVTYLLAGEWPGLQPGYVVMAIQPVADARADSPAPQGEKVHEDDQARGGSVPGSAHGDLPRRK